MTGADSKPANPYVRRFSSPDEEIDLADLHSKVITIGGVKVSYDIQSPGWRWSTHVRQVVGTEWCEAHHVGVVLSGRMRIHLRDGTEFEAGPLDVVDIPPGHDAWVVGDEPFVRLARGGVEGRGVQDPGVAHSQGPDHRQRPGVCRCRRARAQGHP